jgi:hypothetical protein
MIPTRLQAIGAAPGLEAKIEADVRAVAGETGPQQPRAFGLTDRQRSRSAGLQTT